MKKGRFAIDRSEGFVLGIAIDKNDIQFGLIAWLVTFKFTL